MDKRDGPVADISLERDEILHAYRDGNFSISTLTSGLARDENSKIPPQAIFNNSVKTIKLLTQEKFIPLPGCLTKQASLASI
jgi:hypothetical protein